MIMKYFTSDWFSSKLSEDEIDRISDEYWAYIDSIFEKLPFALKILSKSINLHDGIVVNTNFNRESHLLKLDFFAVIYKVAIFFYNWNIVEFLISPKMWIDLNHMWKFLLMN